MESSGRSAGTGGGGTTPADDDQFVFSRLVRDGKKYAAEGELSKALSCLSVAYNMRPAPRILKYITKIKTALNDGDDDSGEDDTSAAADRNGEDDGCQESAVPRPSHKENVSPALSSSSSSAHVSHALGTADRGTAGRHSVCSDAASAKPKKRTLVNKYVTNQDSDRTESVVGATLGSVADGDMAPNGIVLRSVWNRLYAHQRQGLGWLLGLHTQGVGGILADDMGLGKTVQITVFLASLISSGRIHAALVLAPVSVLTTWQNEIKKWYPTLRLGCFHGTSKKQRELDLERVQRRGGICLSTYGMVRSGFNELTKHGSFSWDCLVLDEGHMIRNNNKTTKQIYELAAEQRLVLTGTPIMNRLEELWRLFDFVTKGNLLGPLKDFKEKYEHPIMQCHSKSSTDDEKHAGKSVSDGLQRRIAPYMLRRTKAEVMESNEASAKAAAATAGNAASGTSSAVDSGGAASQATDGQSGDAHQDSQSNASSTSTSHCTSAGDASNSAVSGGAEMARLGEKRDLIVWVQLAQPQLKLYLSFVTGSKVQEALMEQRSALPKLMLLKKITDHPALLSDSEKTSLIDEDDLASERGLQGDYVESESDDDIIDDSSQSQSQSQSYRRPAARPWLSTGSESLVKSSGKLSVLLPLVEALKATGHRVLIFSQMTKMLDIVESVLRWKGILSLRLDGNIRKVADRQRVIDKFSSEKKYTCFLLTTQVGGVGLTLTAADRVIIVDPSWNPAIDAQAVDRAYRIGQQRSVVVYRLITCGTIEEKIYRKQVFKDSVNQQVTGDSSQPLRYFTQHELRNLFMLDNPWQSSTQERLSQLEDNEEGSDSDAWMKVHREFFAALGCVQGLSEHHLQLNVDTDEDFWDENKLEGSGHSDTILRKHKLLIRAKRFESNGGWKLALMCHLHAVRLDPGDLMVQFRCLQLTAQLGLWK